MALTTYEALSLLAHRVAVHENERNDLQQAFLDSFGTDDEKKRFYTESDGDKALRLEKEKFDKAVAVRAAEIAKENDDSAKVEKAAKAKSKKAAA